ncbi:MAG: mannose-1-phosphate guanylyltransferase/mannose-6-phosphate isomerase [Gammaproteobacteria bacterium]|nr:MAG: mannose-1-phosphate guanylyltransferase/mannose-6-phosphate isomerase [Gammaproteobacteria bacterium]
MFPALQPVILSGGSGTRLWPLSRSAFPKQFHALVDDLTLLQATARRCDQVEGCDILAPMVVCNEAHRFMVADQLLDCEIEPNGILLEPVGRNTAPALTLAALHAIREGNDPLLLVMPADHVIRDQERFRAALAEGARHAAEGRVVTFGIVPDSPHTGYGYIRQGEPLGDQAFRLDAFVEKPDRATAEGWLAEGGYLWNSGIFMLSAQRWLDLMQRFRPDILEPVQQAYAAGKEDLDFYRADEALFAASPADSIDYAVMEPLSREEDACVVVPLDAGWSDIGAWEALWAVSDHDADGNAVHGDVLTENAHDNLLFAQSRMVAAVGVDDLVVVETPDAVLVAHKDHAQDVKKIAERLKAQDRGEHEFHRCVHRPWGTFEGIDEGHRFQVKRLTVKPGATLSLQMHHHRAEHWIVVRGTAKVTRGDETFLLTENQSTYIPIGTAHRLENPGHLPLEIIEVQSGAYLGEDDIVRFDDKYNREGRTD